MAGMDTWREEDTISPKEKEQTILKVNPTQGKHRATDRRREDEVRDYEEGMKSPEPKAPSVTQQNMSYLEDCIDTLFKRVEMLGIRLESVLSEGSPEVAAERRSYGGNSPLSEQLAMFCRRLNDLQDRLEYLTARIDL